MHGVNMAEQHAASTKRKHQKKPRSVPSASVKPMGSMGIADLGALGATVAVLTCTECTECTEAVSKNSASWEAWQLDIAWHAGSILHYLALMFANILPLFVYLVWSQSLRGVVHSQSSAKNFRVAKSPRIANCRIFRIPGLDWQATQNLEVTVTGPPDPLGYSEAFPCNL